MYIKDKKDWIFESYNKTKLSGTVYTRRQKPTRLARKYIEFPHSI